MHYAVKIKFNSTVTGEITKKINKISKLNDMIGLRWKSVTNSL